MPRSPDCRTTDFGPVSVPEARHLLTFEGHVTHLTDRDHPLPEHLDVEATSSNALTMKIGGPSAMTQELARIAEAGHREVMCNPAGPDAARALEAFARIGS